MAAATTKRPQPHPQMRKCFLWVNVYLQEYYPMPQILANDEFTEYKFLTDDLTYFLRLEDYEAVRFEAVDPKEGVIFFSIFMPPRRDQFWAIMRILDIK